MKVGTELRKAGANEYDVVAGGRVIGRVWDWHGSWSAGARGKAHRGLENRKEAIARVEHVYRPKR